MTLAQNGFGDRLIGVPRFRKNAALPQ